MGLNLKKITGGLAVAGAIGDLIFGDSGIGGNKTTEYIWKFKQRESAYASDAADEGARKYGYGPAPALVGFNSSGIPGTIANKNDPVISNVNVVDNFAWTQSPKSAREDVPYLMLNERKIQVNPQLNQIANNLYVIAQKGARGTEMLKTMTPESLREKIANNEVKPENDLGAKLLSTWDDVTAGAQNFSAGSGVLAPYENLYYTKPSGFSYILPYLENQYKQQTNSFGGGDGLNSSILNTANNITKGLKNLATAFNILEPGTYVEQPKLYDFGSRQQKQYSITIPLINTNTFNDVIKNWQLIFLLIYQNTPNRLTRDLIDPPCIYEANIPGTWYSKYSYISQISVDFVGATRKMDIQIPTEVTADGSGTTQSSFFNVETVIPDVYQLSLTIKEIFPETQNMMFHSINETNRKVTTNSSQSNLPGPLQGLADKIGLNF